MVKKQKNNGKINKANRKKRWNMEALNPSKSREVKVVLQGEEAMGK